MEALEYLRPTNPPTPETNFKEEEWEEDADFEHVLSLLKKLKLNASQVGRVLAVLH